MPKRRRIITIDEEKRDGCGHCVPACAEGAIQVIGGKARLVSETYCDGQILLLYASDGKGIDRTSGADSSYRVE